jgi:type VI secretion system protein ImpK
VPLARSRTLVVLPVWAVAAAGAVVVIATLLVLNAQLNGLARPAFRQIAAVPAALRAAVPAVAAAAAGASVARVATPLAADAAGNALEVRDEPLRSVVVLPADALFAAGTAQLDPKAGALLGRIAQALAGQPGQIVVSGHADNAPVSSLQFPSSWHLTRARASAIAAALVKAGVRADRVRAEGLADAEPRGPNTTAADRARNRRIEIVLQLPRPDAP